MTSVRIISCPNCDSVSVNVERTEMDNSSMNVSADLSCNNCGNLWKGEVTNPNRMHPFLLNRRQK